MAVVAQAKGVYAAGTTSFIADVPAAIAADDILLIVMESSDAASVAGTPNTPAGWTKLFEESQGDGLAGVTTLTIFGKVATGSETDVTVDGVLNHCSGTMFAIRGAKASLAAADLKVGTGAGADTGNMAAVPGITVDESGCLGLLVCVSTRDADSTVTFSLWASVNGTNETEWEDNTTLTATGGGIGVAWFDAPASGSTGDGSATIAISNKWRAVQLIFEPAAGAGPQSITAAGGIASAEAFGVPLVRFVARNAGAIASLEAFGEPRVVRRLHPVALASAENFGQPRLTPIVRPLGVVSAEAFGSSNVRFTVYPLGIASTEAFGVPNLLVKLITAAGGIASAEAFGQPRVTFIVRPLGLASAEAFGSHSLARQIRLAGGIATAEAFGEPKILLVLRPLGIATAEALGEPRLTRILQPLAIASLESFGSARVLPILRPAGIGSAEAFGIATLTILAAPGGPAVFGSALLTDAARYGVLVSDGQAYLVLVTDVSTAETLISDRPGG